MARECFRSPVILDGLVPAADHNDTCHFTMAGRRSVHGCSGCGNFYFLLYIQTSLFLEGLIPLYYILAGTGSNKFP